MQRVQSQCLTWPVASRLKGQQQLGWEMTKTQQEKKEKRRSVESQVSVDTESQSRVWFWSHHLISKIKRKDIIALAAELHLCGWSRIGYPGVVVVEGPTAGVHEFTTWLKGLQWAALQVRAEEELEVGDPVLRTTRPEGGMGEVDSMSELAQKMREAGLHDMFVSIMKIR